MYASSSSVRTCRRWPAISRSISRILNPSVDCLAEPVHTADDGVDLLSSLDPLGLHAEILGLEPLDLVAALRQRSRELARPRGGLPVLGDEPADAGFKALQSLTFHTVMSKLSDATWSQEF